MLEVLEDSSLREIRSITHGFFTRKGGVSTGVHASLSCAYVSDDHLDNVRENTRLVADYFDYSFESLISVKNVHGNTAIIVDKIWDEASRPMADALVTDRPNIILGSDSADCPIVLFADSQAHVIGLAHAGWRGAIGGVIKSTIEKMVALGANPSHISAAISPCIAQQSYEVGIEFYQQFLAHDQHHRQYFKEGNRAKHFQFDLLGFVKGRLLKLDLKLLSDEVAFDTFSDERFFSCRRAFKKGDTSFGGHFSCIFLS